MPRSKPSKNFYIAALPRSRTAWLSTMFCTKDSFCFHEAFSRFGEIPLRTERYVGTSETCIDLIPKDGRTLIVHRDITDCFNSALSSFEVPMGIDRDEYKKVLLDTLIMTNKGLDKIEGLHVNFEDIDNRIVEIWRYLIPGVALDKHRLNEMSNFNVQIIETDLWSIE